MDRSLLRNLQANSQRLATYRWYRAHVWCDQQRSEDELRTDRDALDVCLHIVREDLDTDLETLFAALPRQREAT